MIKKIKAFYKEYALFTKGVTLKEHIGCIGYAFVILFY